MEKLNFIDETLTNAGIPYEFGEWSHSVPNLYWVGEITEFEPLTEDGFEESEMILTGVCRGKRIELEKHKAIIKKLFPAVHGLRAQLENGAIAVFYGGSHYIPTAESNMIRMEITLSIKEWKGAM